jgi:transcriptional regulator with XRE-family HTH domain
MDFATQLRVLRTARGLTQQQLADRCDIPNTMISNMETGKVIPTGEWLSAIKATLNWPADDSFFEQISLITK